MRNMSFDIFALRKKTAIRILLKSLIWAFALFGILFILLLTAILGMLSPRNGSVVSVPEKAVLQIDFDQKFDEIRPDSLLEEINSVPQASFYDLSLVISAAVLDNRIEAIAAKVGNSELSLAQIQELRNLIKMFRDSGKKAYVFSNGFGSFGGGMSEYYLASVFDEIILQPGTETGITGISIEMPFIRKLLDKAGIEPEFYARHEYKNAFASFTDEKMPEVLREELGKLGENLFEQIVRETAKARGFRADRLKRLINQAPLDAKESLKERLVDKLEYQENMLAALEKEYSAQRIDWLDYFYSLKPSPKTAPVVAVLAVSGEIADGPSVLSSFKGDAVAGADTFISQLKEIAEIENLRALVVRIDSPGGSYTAADTMRQALADFKAEKQIPVIVSMSSYAASGGYFIALPADKIIADGASLTGSIGVLGGKPVLSGLWKKLDIVWDGVSFGENAGILSLNHPFSVAEKEVFNKSLDNVYEDFVSKTAKARNISLKKMDELARGRIWTGEQALENRLIDELGGYNEAVAAAKALAGLETDAAFRTVFYPRPKTMQEKIAELMSAAPFAAANRLKMQIGLDNSLLNVLKRLQYDAVMLPLVVRY